MATIRIDLDRRIGTISPLIYGSFIEHLGRCIYDGIVDAEQAAHGEYMPRADTLDAIRTLRVPILRWPGGNFVSGYHWLDGVGPIAQRPRRLNLASGIEESNIFGTAEFVAYCRLIGAEPYICLNMGTGSLDEAQAWVEYCNGTGHTSWANLRRMHGYDEPFDVRYWGLGNEVYGDWQLGAKRAVGDYTTLAVEMAKVVRRTDPRVALVSCGLDGLSPWDAEVLGALGAEARYHSIHLYTGNADYYQNVFMPHQAERGLRVAAALIEMTGYQRQHTPPVRIAFDEWGVFHREFEPRTGLEEPYDLADALAVATYFNIFHRACRVVEIANQSLLVNALAPIVTTQAGVYYNTTYWPYLLYRRHCQEVALDAWVDSPTHALALAPGTPEPLSPLPHRVADLGPFPYLDVSATVDAAGECLTLAVVNRHREEALDTRVEVRGAEVADEGRVYEVNGADERAGNSVDCPDRVGVREFALTTAGQFTYAFPAHSLTVLTLRCQRQR